MNRARERRNATQHQPTAIPPKPSPEVIVKAGEDIPAQYTEDSPLIIDNTILSASNICSTKGLIAYHHHLISNEDSNPLLVGTAAHKALEVFFRGSSTKEAMKVFQDLYYPYGNLLAPEESLSWENTQATMETWFAGHALESLSFKPLPGMIEGALITPLWPEKWGKRVMFLGLIDLLVKEKSSGQVMLMDHKTTSRRLDDTWVQQFRTSSQLSGYAWIVNQIGIQEKLDLVSPISAALINTIQFSRLPQSDRKCPTHAVPYSVCKGMHAVARLDGPFARTPLQLNQWLANARKLAHKWAWARENHPTLSDLRAAKKEGLFQFEACKFCSYQSFCEGSIVDGNRLPQFFRKQEWKPWKQEDKVYSA